MNISKSENLIIWNNRKSENRKMWRQNQTFCFITNNISISEYDRNIYIQ